MSDVFISYAREDQQQAGWLAALLVERGWSVFWDRTIPPGKSWDEVIGTELESARAVVVLWSAAAVASEFVKEEAHEAKDRGVLVPALLEEVKLPFGFRRIQAAPLLDWSGDAAHAGLGRLLAALVDMLGAPAGESVADSAPPLSPSPPLGPSAVPDSASPRSLPPPVGPSAAPAAAGGRHAAETPFDGTISAVSKASAGKESVDSGAGGGAAERSSLGGRMLPVLLTASLVLAAGIYWWWPDEPSSPAIPVPAQGSEGIEAPAAGAEERSAAPAVPVPDMVTIAPGRFDMGGDFHPGERPVHLVTLARAFAIGRYAVTFDEYDPFAEATGRALPSDWGWGRGRRPVINVSWQDAQAYAAWLSAQTGQSYRLPTEAEWEYAARAGTQTRYWWGDEVRRGETVMANCDGCGSEWDNKQAAPVGQFEANAFGLHDMNGNVFEWVQDCLHESYAGAPGDGSAWLEGEGGDCGQRVLRGGAWNAYPGNLRSASRTYVPSDMAHFAVGFRLAQDQ